MAEINVKYVADVSPLTAAIDEVDRHNKKLQDSSERSGNVLSNAAKQGVRSQKDYSDAVKKTIAMQQQQRSTTKEYEKAISELVNKLTRLDAEQKRATNIAAYKKLQTQIIELRKEVDRLNKELKETGNAQTKATGATSGMLNTLKGGLATIGAFFAVDQVLSFARSVFGITSEFQKLEAVLTTALGNKSAAQASLKTIKDFAAETPYSVAELTDSYVKLVNMGFKPTTNELKSLGDLAASTGKSFDQLAEAILDAQTFEFERLKEFGVRTQQNGNRIAFTFKGITTEVDKSSEAVKAYVLSLGELNGVAGSMEGIAQTLGGQISNLGDAWDGFLTTIGNRSNSVFSDIIAGARKTIEFLTFLYGSAEQDLSNSVITRASKESKSQIDFIKQDLADAIKAGKDPLNELARLADEHDKINEGALKELGVTIQETQKRIDAYTKNLKRSDVFGKSRSDQEAKKEELQRELDALNYRYDVIEKTIDINESEVLQIRKKYEAERAELQAKADEALRKQREKAAKEAAEQLKKDIAERLRLLAQLEKDAEKARLELIGSGTQEYLDQRRISQENEVNELAKHIQDLNRVTGNGNKLTAQQESQLADLRAEIRRKYIEDSIALQDAETKKRNELLLKGLNEEQAIREEQIKQEYNELFTDPIAREEAKQKAILALKLEYAKKSLALLQSQGGEENKLQIEQLKTLISDIEKGVNAKIEEAKTKENKNYIAELLGLTDENYEALSDAAGQAMNALSDMFETERQQAEQRIAKIDSEIAKREEALQKEIQLNKDGKASNIAEEKEKIEALRVQREKALKDQQAAARRQQAIETVQQVSSMITASAQIMANTAKDPITLGIAIASIAAMFAAFVAAKEKANASANKAPKFEKGGSLTLEGGRHSEGGVNLIDSKTGRKVAEAEGGEELFFMSRGNTYKYRDLIKMMHNNDFGGLDLAKLPNAGRLKSGLPKAINSVKNNAAIRQFNDYRELSNELRMVRAELADIKKTNRIMANEEKAINFKDKVVVKSGNVKTITYNS